MRDMEFDKKCQFCGKFISITTNTLYVKDNLYACRGCYENDDKGDSKMTYGQMLRGLNEEQKLLILDEIMYSLDNEAHDMTSECDEKWEYAFKSTTAFVKERLADIYIDDQKQDFYNAAIEEGEK